MSNPIFSLIHYPAAWPLYKVLVMDGIQIQPYTQKGPALDIFNLFLKCLSFEQGALWGAPPAKHLPPSPPATMDENKSTKTRSA